MSKSFSHTTTAKLIRQFSFTRYLYDRFIQLIMRDLARNMLGHLIQ